MEIKKILLILFTNFITTILCENHLLIDQLRLDFLDLEERLWEFVLWEAPTIKQKDAEFHLIKNFNRFDQKLKQMPEDILRGLEPIRHTRGFLFLYSELKNTDNMYEKFRVFQEDQQKMHNDKTTITDATHLEDIVRDILNPKSGANVTIQKVYDLTMGKESMAMEILDLLVKNFNCKDFFQSPEQVFYNLYNSIALHGLKSYIMLQFAYLARRIGEKGNYTELSNLAQINFQKQVNETMSVLRGAMEMAPKTIWRCDPKHHIKGKTYVEITRLIQGHVQNEVDMNAGGTCRDNCAFYPLSTSHGCYDHDSKYCQEMERCTGKLIECQFIESHMDICLSKTSSRRYDYVQYQSGKIMGKKSQCWKKPVQSWWRWFVHCSYCMCLCDEQGPKSDRYFNMRPVLADIENNRVVTGLRFVKHNRIVHLQIQEGKLLPYGYINNATVHWVPVDKYKITDPGVYSGEDYFTMSYENRSLALDQVAMNDHGYVLTGVRFVFKDKMLRLQINVRPFDWNNGTVSQTISTSMYKSSGGKYEIDLSKADVPTESPPTEICYNTDSYIKFTHTDFDADAAQTTIPFIDAQPTFSNPPVPLRGVGIHYKGKSGYGGSITPSIMTYSYSHLLLVRFPKIEERNLELINEEPTTTQHPFSNA